MPRTAIGTVLHYIHHLVDRSGSAETTDAQLLARFVTHRDEAAFEAIVRRHGPMVLAVCRRLLTDAQEAEDAFQATFLILVRKAASLSRPDRLAGWLHGVAARIAGRRRHDRLRHPTAPLEDEPPAEELEMDDVMRRELAAILDEEVARLPARYQTPFVLCHLGGRTNDEAARELGCPAGTIFSRLARARAILRDRLARRGLVFSAATLGLVLSSHAAPAAVPPALLQQTITSGTLLAAGQTLAAVAVSAQTITFVEATLQAMYLSKLKMAAFVMLLVLAASTGLGMISYRAFAGGEPVTVAAAPPAADAKPAADGPTPAANEKLRQELKVLQDQLKAIQERQVLEGEIKKLRADLDLMQGKPATDAKLGTATYRGKPASHWISMVRDCDAPTRLQGLNAVTAMGDELGDDAPLAAAAVEPILKTYRMPALPLGMPVGFDAAEAIKAAGLPVNPASVQIQAIAALGAIGPAAKRAIPKLVAIQLDTNIIPWSTAGTIGAFGLAVEPDEAFQDPMSALVSSAIVRIDPEGKQAVSLLLPAVKRGLERNWRMRADGIHPANPTSIERDACQRALDTLAKYEDQAAPAVVSVANLLRNKDVDNSSDVLKVLRAVGEPGKAAAVPALTALSKDKDADVAAAAARVFVDLYPVEAEKAGVKASPLPGGA